MNIVHLTDCMDFMKDKPDNCYGLAIVDPPYALKNKWSSSGGQSLKPEEVEKMNQWDKRPNKLYFDEIKRIAENQIIWGANHFNDYLDVFRSVIIWDKKLRNLHFADGEMAWSSFKKGALRIFEHRVNNKPNMRIHPTQKPVALYKWLLQNYAKPGQTIFDSHVGSGSIRIACHDMGFDFEGCEIDADYYEAQEKRYQIHAAQGRLFDDDEMQRLIF